MALKKQKTKILLPRREVLLSGSLGALGMAIGFSISNILFQLCASRIVYNKLKINTTPIQ